ncbi:L-serine ammonia-lyase [Diaphorobacter caeni]|uniref:L-serine ammonia-lyase n=1 Tax=Diaphorobacter caeni TaxID=2784387 RepID=UPI00188DFBF7|nr:L-serine ammonia-lyase [Diaphorobacter caeni]MBF5004261.1 L-serine ammonia-lyase [Diaphorobacter caeni]
MYLSVFDIFKVGIGPSSSHTVGPMRAARSFAESLRAEGLLSEVARVRCELYGSLGATGKGHASDTATLLGLAGHDPESVDVDLAPGLVQDILSQRELLLAGVHTIAFDCATDLLLLGDRTLPLHVNGMRFLAIDASGRELLRKVYYSVGGGFVVEESQALAPAEVIQPPIPFDSGESLLAATARLGCSIADVMRRNEAGLRPAQETDERLRHIWSVMQACIARGLRAGGHLPGAFRVRRRAADLHRLLDGGDRSDPLVLMDWVNLFALAVNEENAAGGRVVTAPTNGAAGIIPAVLAYHMRFAPNAREQDVGEFLLTAAAIAILYKKNASISGAEVGCQGEVGVACSMAAGALCAVMGGTPAQVENAAEIGMEHHLGLTCDPVGGLVQIPCIERNALASVKAINAARMALRGDGSHHVSLDKVIRTMRETGADMMSKYKETALGGLALHVVAC